LLDHATGAIRQELLTYEYDRAGNLVRATDLYKTTFTFAYDAANRMTRRTDRRGYSFHFEYDEQGRCIHSRGDDGLLDVFLDYQPDARNTIVRRGDGGRWVYTYNAGRSITKITDPYGNATDFTLDELGRVIQEIDPNGNVTQLHYDEFGHHDYRVDPNGHLLPTPSVDPNPPDPLAYVLPETSLAWEFGHLIVAEDITQPEPGDPILDRFPREVVDSVLGRPTIYDPAANSDPSGESEPQNLRDDDFNRPIEESGHRFTQRWQYDPNGNLIVHQDRDGSVYRWAFESWNALSREVDPFGNVTSYEHSVQGLVARVTDAGGTVTEYEYDLNEQLVEVRQRPGNEETYRRDRAGNIVEKRGAHGRILVTWEIARGNLDKVRTQASGEQHLFEHDERGRITKAETPAGVATFSYDVAGRILSDKRDGKGVAHEFGTGRLIDTTYFESFHVKYSTSDDGSLIINDPTGARHVFQYGESGLIRKLLANGTRELCQYDPEGRCLHKIVLHGNGDAPWLRNYSYSGSGDLLAARDTRRGLTKYRHDAAHRLIEESGPRGSARRFEHDVANNLVSQPNLTGVTIGQGNRIQTANGDSFIYNDRDHISARSGASGTTTYDYNDLDMLVRCDINGEAWTAGYDAYGRRIKKTWHGRTTTYYWDDFRLAAELRHEGSVRIYIYADEAALVPFMFVEYASLEAEPGTGQRYYVFTNQVGAPIRVDGSEGERRWTGSISPYGVAEGAQDNALEMPLRFPGHYHDPETGLHCNRFRYYSPELGRYLQSDPAGQEGAINVYAYPVNPLVGVDIDGLRGGGGGRRSGRKGKSAPAGANVRCPPGGTHSSRRMVDQMIRDGHIVIDGDKKYKNAVKRDLYRIASSETGRNTLTTIRNSGQPTTIKPWAPGKPYNGCAGGTQPGARPRGSVPSDPAHGVGTGTGAPSTVRYNPHDTTRPPESPPDAGLNHELGHAAHNASGTNARDNSAPVPAAVKNCPNLEEHNNTANEDNAYRRERGLKERDDYNKLP